MDQQSCSAGVRRCVDVWDRFGEQTAGRLSRQRPFRDEEGSTDRGVNVALRHPDTGSAFVRQDETSIDRCGHIVRMTLYGSGMTKQPIWLHPRLGQSGGSHQASDDCR
jgi:hypothetical protein